LLNSIDFVEFRALGPVAGYFTVITTDKRADMGLWARRGILGGGLALAGAALAGCHRGDSGPLHIAITGKGENDLELLLKSAGLTPEFPVAYSRFQSGHLVVEAMNSGAIELGGMSEIPPVFAAASTVQSFKQVAIYHGDVNNQVVLVPKGSTIQSLADLKGKKVGYVRSTTTQYYLIQMLKSVGLTWDDIEPVALTVPDGAEAFGRGSLDAWAIYGYPIQQAVAKQGARVLKTALGFLSGNYLLAATKDALADPVRAGQIGAYIALIAKGFAWADAHQDAWIGIVAKDIGVPEAYVRDQFARRSDPFQIRPVSAQAIASQQSVADVFAAAKLIPHPVDVKPLWDDRYTALIAKGV
jgi:sulfonate transport system substrate-binding protein